MQLKASTVYGCRRKVAMVWYENNHDNAGVEESSNCTVRATRSGGKKVVVGKRVLPKKIST